MLDNLHTLWYNKYEQREGKPYKPGRNYIMATTNTTTTTINKIDLTAKAQAYHTRLRAEKRARGIRFVEDTLLPQLIDLAEGGIHFYSVKPPIDVDLDDVIKALHERANCSASKSGYQGKISISW